MSYFTDVATKVKEAKVTALRSHLWQVVALGFKTNFFSILPLNSIV